MQERHLDREKYFEEQTLIAEKVLVPYISSGFPISSQISVLEIGCGEAGNLHPFLTLGCKVTGIDCSAVRIERAAQYYATHPLRKDLALVVSDIFETDPRETGTFDLVILRDSLEHIPNKEKLISHIKKFLSPGGHIFISFPPWQMPFGGHQQLCRNKFIRRLPYIHLLPRPLFFGLLKCFGEKHYLIEELLQIRRTRISIERFKSIAFQNNFRLEREDLYFINPAYEIKFGIRAKKLPELLNIRWLHNFYTTAFYCLLVSDPNFQTKG